MFSILPFRVPRTSAREALNNSEVTDIFALSVEGRFSLVMMRVFSMATGPVERTDTSYQMPMPRSGGVGFQSTHVIVRSIPFGGKISNARQFSFPANACLLYTSP